MRSVIPETLQAEESIRDMTGKRTAAAGEAEGGAERLQQEKDLALCCWPSTERRGAVGQGV